MNLSEFADTIELLKDDATLLLRSLFHQLMDLQNFRYTPHQLGHSSQAYGYVQCTCPAELRPKVHQAAEAADQPHQQELVGQIQDEYLIYSLGDDPDWNDFLKCAAIAHETSFPGYWAQLKKCRIQSLACILPCRGSIECRNMNTILCTYIPEYYRTFFG